MSSDTADRILRPKEAAAYIGVDPDTLAMWAENGQIPCHRTIGGHRRYRQSDLDELLWEADR